MGAWSLPFDSEAAAKKLIKKLQKPWLAKVKFKGKDYDWNLGNIYSLYGDDAVFDLLDETARRKKKDFDASPIVKKALKAHLKEIAEDMDGGEEFPEFPLEALNLLRTFVRLPKYKPKKNKVLNSKKQLQERISELFLEEKIEIRQIEIDCVKAKDDFVYVYKIPKSKVEVSNVILAIDSKSKKLDANKVKSLLSAIVEVKGVALQACEGPVINNKVEKWKRFHVAIYHPKMGSKIGKRYLYI